MRFGKPRIGRGDAGLLARPAPDERHDLDEAIQVRDGDEAETLSLVIESIKGPGLLCRAMESDTPGAWKFGLVFGLISPHLPIEAE